MFRRIIHTSLIQNSLDFHKHKIMLINFVKYYFKSFRSIFFSLKIHRFLCLRSCLISNVCCEIYNTERILKAFYSHMILYLVNDFILWNEFSKFSNDFAFKKIAIDALWNTENFCRKINSSTFLYEDGHFETLPKQKPILH